MTIPIKDHDDELIAQIQLAKKTVLSLVADAIDALKGDEPDFSAAKKAAADALKRYQDQTYGYAETDEPRLKGRFEAALEAIEDEDAKKAIAELEKVQSSRYAKPMRKKQATEPDPPESETARERLAMDLRITDAGEFEVLVMTPGEGNGWNWLRQTLQRDYAVFDGVTSFIDHDYERPGRSARDICGVVYNPRWDDGQEAIVALWRPRAPKGTMAMAIVEDYLAAVEAGEATPDVGLSADLSFRHQNKHVTELVEAHSVDVVYNPARGGRFVRAVLQAQGAGPQPDATRAKEDPPMPKDTQDKGQALLKQLSATVLRQTLSEADLPAAAEDRVRTQFADQEVIDPEALETAIQAERDYLASLAEDETITGLPGHEEQPTGIARVGGAVLTTPTSDPMDRIELGLVRYFGGELPGGVEAGDVPRIDLPQLYADLTGDLGVTGRWDIPSAIERTGLANITGSTFGGVIADSMNVVIVQQWDILAAEGYEWYRKVFHEQDFDSLHEVEWVTVGGFGDLSEINFGDAVDEISISDLDTSEDTGDWQLRANLITAPLDVFEKAARRGAFKSLPKKLGVAGIRTLSSVCAAVFTSNSDVGPTLADGDALFHSNHSNLATTALSFNAWVAAVQDHYKQTEQESDKRLAVRPWGICVPIELEGEALQTLMNPSEHDATDRNINPYQYAKERVVTVPDWTDADNWMTFTSPKVFPGAGVGYRYGRKPQVVPEPGGKQSQGMWLYNAMRWKVQFVFVVSVINHRAFQKRNVT